MTISIPTEPFMRPTWVQVDLAALEDNLAAIRSAVSPARVMPMVKANAYGHGIEAVARAIEPLVDYFGVALTGEGILLRRIGVTKPILVTAGTLVEELPAFLAHDLTATAPTTPFLAAADELAGVSGRRLKVHLKIDTGMERLGMREYEAEPFLEASWGYRNLEIEGIFTHLANGEIADRRHSLVQLERFQNVLDFYTRRGRPVPPLRHVCNSGGILHLPEGYLDLVRPGLLLYGIYPGSEGREVVRVTPALSWHSRVVQSKITMPGRPVSYGSLWQPAEPTQVVTLPCGYADGYSRRMSNLAQVSIRGRRRQQVGRICMDQFMVNTDEETVEVGELVTLLGQGISADELAEWSGTNAYEVLTSISERVPRRYTAG